MGDKPREEKLKKARTFDGDLRNLPRSRPVKRERPEREEPQPNPGIHPDTSVTPGQPESAAPHEPDQPSAPAPAPSKSFDGLNFAAWGSGHPPDTVGDVGPTYYIQSVNASVGIFRKSDGVRVAAFTLDTLMSQGAFGNLCDTDNFGDPVVLYDSFEDRWVITDFAFQLSGGSVVNPPGMFQCIAVSKSGDPVAGGWNFYSINTANGLGDYPKFGIWPDGLYMTTSMFSYMSGGTFQNPRVYAFNKAQMYAGEPTVQVISFDGPADDFTILPSNARLQAGTPPPGTPNYFVSTWQFLNALSVYKFHVDWDRPALSTFTGPETPLAATSWPNAAVGNAPSQGGSNLDVIQIRAMMQNQYSNLGGVESLWNTHTVRRADTSGFAAPRWYQLDVTGGTVSANVAQAATFDPDGANVLHRFVPSLAVDRAGNMALGYSTSSSTTKPALKYAGRLATDPADTLGQGEQLLIQGTGTQVGTSRWGDYAAMSLDPDGCTFWFTTEYYAVDGLNDLTRIGAFAFPQCTPFGSGGTLSGTVTDGASPIAGATVTLGTRTTTTNAGGVYTFAGLPAGTYPSVAAASAGYGPAAAASVVINDGATTTKNFALAAAQTSACPADTSLSDFQTAVPANVDIAASAGNAVLAKPSLDQFNVNVGGSAFGLNATAWGGQTFTPSVTGQLKRADIKLFCSGCTGTTPDLTLSVRATSGGLPTGSDLASATITGFGDSFSLFYTATFAAPATLTAGTQYALLVRPNANPSAGTYALIRSVSSGSGQGFNTYSGGARVSSTDGGGSWTIPTNGGSTTDTAFHTYMDSGFAPSGDLTSALKDANPPANSVPHWTTLSWTAATPAGTAVKFQAAAGNSASGPFSFVGPDGTAATFFTTSGASLSQFDGKRYLKYKAFLSTSDAAATPTVADVTACFLNVAPTVTAAAPLTRQQGSAAVNSQIATVGDPVYSANTLSVTATPLTGTGVTVNNIAVDATGKVTANVAADCSATNSTFTLKVTDGAGATASATLTVNVALNTAPALAYGAASVNITEGKTVNPSTAPNDNGSLASVVLQSAGTYTGGVSVNGSTGAVTITNAAPLGTHTITVRATDNCGLTTDASFSLTVNKIDQTITFGALPNRTFGDADFQVSATASSGLGVSFTAAGNCTVTGNTAHITGAGSCTVTASQAGDGTYNAAPGVQQSFQIAKAATSTALSSSGSPAAPGQSVTFTATVTSPAGTPAGSVQFKADGANLGSPVALNAGGVATFNTSTLAAGAHAVTADYSGNSNFNASSAALSGGQVVGSVFDFSQGLYNVAERGGSIVINVTRTGLTAQAATVDYATDDGSVPTVAVPCSATTGRASERCDYTRAAGTLGFAANETQKTFTVLVNDDSDTEGSETLALRLSNPGGGAALGAQAVSSLQIADDPTESAGNPVDDAAFFVRQHYHDFLNREPDAEGFQFWTDEITSCGSDAGCREVKRINVSAAFFLSIEFQQTGFLVYRIDKAAFGDINAPAVPVPATLNQFLLDTRAIQQGVVVGKDNWPQQLDANKAAFALSFVRRPDFLARYPGTTSAASFVNALDANAGGVLSADEKAALINELAPNPSDAALRASVLRKVAEDADLFARETNRAFVLMQYFGYLRRNPNDAPEKDLNYAGWNFWLGKLEQFGGNYIEAEMVKAFISSDEYRHRFGQ